MRRALVISGIATLIFLGGRQISDSFAMGWALGCLTMAAVLIRGSERVKQ